MKNNYIVLFREFSGFDTAQPSSGNEGEENRYRKKPVVVEARVFEWGMEDGVQRYNEFIPKEINEYHPEMSSGRHSGYLGRYDDLLEKKGFEDGQWKPVIKTIEGNLFISEGDYIITGIKGERYPCKPDIFQATYEPASHIPEQEGEISRLKKLIENEVKASLKYSIANATIGTDVDIDEVVEYNWQIFKAENNLQ